MFISNIKVSQICNHLSSQLFTYDLVLKNIYFNFNQKYSKFKLLKLEDLIDIMPMTLKDFKLKVFEQINESIDYLVKNWIQECIHVIFQNQEHIEALAPKNEEIKRMDLLDKYFETIALLISLLLRRIFENTLNHLKEFFTPYQNSNPKKLIPFICFLNCNEGSMILDPTPDMVYTAFNDLIDYALNSLRFIPRVEISLFENVENLNLKYPNLIDKNEDSIIEIRNFFKNLLDFNLNDPIE